MIGLNVSITASTDGWEDILRRVREMTGDVGVHVGVFTDKAGGGNVHEGGISNVELAAIHEFGAPEANIPERSFIRSTFEQHRNEYAVMVSRLLPRVLSGTISVKQLFDLVGVKIVADINKKVRQEGVPPPLKPETILRKGSSRALIDTGVMLAAVTWVTVIRGARA